ncbi:GNAT family N-acetyltransferase [Lysinibacillus cavernae]|uniref:GNAT family N-acetyltransferase n=1 Tax=Lysinibacillus cavernae TaxID=2666135 RepID=UPI0012D89DF1|nr:GNAT family N-acetyltransferase [Lysinibacillus cavernae]
MLAYRLITDIEALEPYRSTWSGILERVHNNNPFIEYEWISTWWTTLGVHDNVEIYVVEHQGMAIAFFPFVHSVRYGMHHFSFLGQGFATYMEVIAEKQWLERSIDFLLKELSQKYKRYLMVLQGLLESKGTSQTLEKYAIEYQMSYSIFRTVTSYIDFQSISLDEFLKKHRKKFKSLKRREHKLKSLGQVVFQGVKHNHIQDMFTLFTRRWQKKIDKSGFTEKQTRLFYERLAKTNSKAFQVEVDSLQFEGHWIGFTIDLCCRERNFCLAMGHEPDFNRFGPGRIIEKENMLKAHDSGYRYYDFGSGYEPYKFEWYTHIDFTRKFIMSTKGTKERFIRSCMVLRDQLKGKLTNNHQLVKLKRDRLGELRYFVKNANVKDWLSTIKKVLQRIVAVHILDVYIAQQKEEKGLMNFHEVQMKDIMRMNKRPNYVTHFYKGYRLFGYSDEIVYRRHDKIASEESVGYSYELASNVSFIREYDSQRLAEIVADVQREGRTVCTLAPWYDGRRRRKLVQAGFHKVAKINIVKLFKWRKIYQW